MTHEKNKWIEDVLNSAGSLQRQQAGDELFTGVKNRLQGPVRVLKAVPVRTVWLAAASLAILVALNVLIIGSNAAESHNSQTHQQASYSLNNDFELY